MKDPTPETPDLKEAFRQFARLVLLIRPYWTPLLKGMALALMLGLMGMVGPYLTKLLIDEVYPTGNVSLMHLLVAGTLALALSSTVLGTLRGFYTLYINTRVSNATRLMFFNQLQHLTVRFFDQHQVGEINSRFQDVGRALDSISRVFQAFFVQGIYLLLVPPILFLLEWRLALLAIISLPLSFSVIAFSGPIQRRHWKKSSEAYADINAFQIETLSHIRTFKTMALEHHLYSRGREMIDHAMEQQLRAGGLSQFFGAITGLLRGLNTALFTWFGWTLILEGKMTLGDYMAFTMYVGYLYNPISQFIQLFSDFQQSAIHLNRMFEYLDAPVEQDPTLAYAPPAPIRHHLKGSFRFDHVDFSYLPGQPVLSDIDLEFPAGAVTSLVGPSGSGKTSLLRLLAGLERPDSGEIRVDGLPLRELALSDLRRQIAVVWQDVSVIKGSLWENLTLGGNEPARAEVDRVMGICGLEGVLANLPDGYETSVAEWGSSLSAGQRQRVALARALLRRAPILLLDEATANIDVETELKILQRIFAELRDSTVIFVTHRLSSAVLADKVCLLGGGKVHGFGTHQELLNTSEPYRRMCNAFPGLSSTS